MASSGNSEAGSDLLTPAPAIPFVHNFDFTYGTPDEVAPGILRVIANNPGPFTFTGTGTYLLSNPSYDGAIGIIDPGPDNPDHLAALVAAANGRKISHIIVTHTHSDHCGGAKKLQEMTGALLVGSPAHPVTDQSSDAPALEEGADYSYAPDQILYDGDIIEGDGWRLETVATPGHLSNHLCYRDPAQGILFTGDHIMGWATTVIIPPDGSMADYFASLDKLLEQPDRLYLPTHGAPIDNPHRFVRAVRAHRQMRDGQIIHLLKDNPHTIQNMVATMYANVDKRLHVAAALNVLAHLIRLCDDQRVDCSTKIPSLDASYSIK